MIQIFSPISSVEIPCVVVGTDGSPLDPALGVQITIYISGSTVKKISAADMTQKDGKSGYYAYVWDTSAVAAGWYTILIEYTNNGITYRISDVLQIVNIASLGQSGNYILADYLTNSETGDPIGGATVWLATDSTDLGASGIVSVKKITNSFGAWTFNVGQGVYYLFSDQQPEYIAKYTVAGDGTVTEG